MGKVNGRKEVICYKCLGEYEVTNMLTEIEQKVQKNMKEVKNE